MINLTGKESVKEALLIYIKHMLPKSKYHLADEIFGQFFTENRSYIESVLDRACANKWAYVQVSTLSIDRIVADKLRKEIEKG